MQAAGPDVKPTDTGPAQRTDAYKRNPASPTEKTLQRLSSGGQKEEVSHTEGRRAVTRGPTQLAGYVEN